MRVIIIGCGIVGASAAYYLVKQHVDVVMIDQAHKGQATAAGAGIICPWTSKLRGKAWYKLAKAGARFYPSLIEDLATDGKKDVSYQKVGALVTSKSQTLERFIRELKEEAMTSPEIGHVEKLSSEDARHLFPPLHKDLEAVFIPGAARVDGNFLRNTLLEVAKNYGAKQIIGEASLTKDGNHLKVTVNEENIHGDYVLITAGAWAPQLLAPLGIQLNIHPQRGQIVHLKVSSENTKMWPVVLSEGSSHYMLAFHDSRIVIGATRETGSGFDYRMTAGGLQEVLSEGLTLAPGLASATLSEVRIGFRPMGPDYLPLLGPVNGLPRVFLANGLGPSGLTIGPYVGKLAATMLSKGEVEVDISSLHPQRAIKHIRSV